jgi:hypothetical protein
MSLLFTAGRQTRRLGSATSRKQSDEDLIADDDGLDVQNRSRVRTTRSVNCWGTPSRGRAA